ncbi:MAG: UvrD-helicase domain-containing protein [Porphyromonadaceae bacterium]|nr:UvrD-helicase domain-containing protein [Porphyromonadaceae bacterium]
MFILKASAGSGKTYNLAMQFILRLIIDGDDAFEHILAVTFTKDATAEMKLRILADLYAIANGQNMALVENIKRELPAESTLTDNRIMEIAQRSLLRILHDYGNFNVGTIDSFFQRVLRNLARELGKGSKFNIDLNEQKAVAEAVRNIVAISHTNGELLNWLRDFVEEKIADEKQWNIENDLREFGRNIFNEEYQTGQHELTQLIDENPDIFKDKITEYKLITNNFEKYLRERAKEFFDKVIENNISEKDFSRGLIFNHFKKFKNRDYGFDNGSTIQNALNDYRTMITKTNKDSHRLLPIMERVFHPLLCQTEKFRHEHIESYLSAKLCLKNIFNLGLLSYISKEVDAQSRDNNRFMLKDTTMVLHSMINPEHDFSFVYEKIGADIQNVMIDEFQDTSLLQWKNFKALLADITASGRFSLLVGDVKQSIYRWRSGDWRILNNIENEFRYLNSKTLDKNWRSAKNIVNFNNLLFANISKMLPDAFAELYGEMEDNPFKRAYGDVIQQVVNSDNEGFVSVDFYEEGKAEALELLVEKLQILASKQYPPDKICILCRTNKDVQTVAEYLAKQQFESEGYNDIVSDEAFLLSSSSAVRLIVSAMQLAANPQNLIALSEIEFVCKRLNISKKITAQMFDKFALKSLYEMAVEIIELFSLHQIEGQAGYIFTFLDYLINYQGENSADITNFIHYWNDELCLKAVGGSSLKGIRVMTIHKSKGLEFDTVILPFFEENMHATRRSSIVWCGAKAPPFDLPIFPINYTKDMQRSIFAQDFIDETVMSLMDSLNVHYVACTRAVRNLFVFAKKHEKRPKNIHIEQLLVDALSIDNGPYVVGKLDEYSATTSHMPASDNPFKAQNLLYMPLEFDIQESNADKAIFIQSNSSREFMFGDDGQRNPFVVEGNIMHHIFSAIITKADIPKAVGRLVLEGVISEADSSRYIRAVEEAISMSAVIDWFSGRYRVLNEHNILYSNSEAQHSISRPDRVMIDGNRAIVVDYKFGQCHPQHRQQLERYSSLLRSMGFVEVEAYLWYVKERNIEKV